MRLIVSWARNKLHGYPLLKKLIKFGMVGFAAALISLSVHFLIILQFPKYNLVGKAVGSIIGFFAGFAMNKLWTYVDRTEDDEKYLGKYLLVYLFTFVIYLLMNYFFDHYLFTMIFYISSRQLWDFYFFKITIPREVVSNLISIIINAVLNFIGTNYLVFKVKNSETTEEIK